MTPKELRDELTSIARHVAEETHRQVQGSPRLTADQAFNSAVYGYMQGASFALDCAGVKLERDRKRLLFAAAMAFGRGWRDCGGGVPKC